MARSHVEFIQSRDVPWRDPSGHWAPAGVRERLLSRDADTGGLTAEWTLPAGWSHAAGYLEAGVEIFVLEGALRTGGVLLREFSYAHIPPGVNAGTLASPDGCRLLWMPDGTHRFTASARHRDGAAVHQYIAAIDTAAIPWAATITPGFPPGAMRKSLRIDPTNGASTWLLGVLPQWKETRTEIHPVSEEAYQLLGEMDTDRGVFGPGCYFWRPPHIPHGPFGTRTGALTFFRTDGPLATYYIDPSQKAQAGTREEASR